MEVAESAVIAKRIIKSLVLVKHHDHKAELEVQDSKPGTGKFVDDAIWL